MSCKHGNPESGCDYCAEEDRQYQLGYEAGRLDAVKASEAGQGVALNYAVVHKFAVDHGIDYNTLAKLVRDSVVATHTQEGR